MRHLIPAAAAALVLALPAAAGAHVTVQPSSVPAGGFTRLDVRVPNEREDEGTVKVDVQMPPGIAFASYEPSRAGRWRSPRSGATSRSRSTGSS